MTRKLGTSKAFLLVALAAVLALGTSACNGSGDSPAAGSSSSSSSQPSSTSPSTPSSSPGGGETDPQALLTTLGEHMSRAGSAHVSAEVAGQRVTGAFTTSGDRTDAVLHLSFPAAGMADAEFRIVDGVSYFSIPSITGAGKFAKIDPSSKTLGPLVSALGSMRPDQALSNLAPAVESVQDLGPATVAGDQTEHYLLLVNSQKAHDLLGSGLNVPDSVTAQIPKVVRYHLYVTPDDLARRTQLTVFGQPFTFDYTDWGAPVHVEAPSAADLVQAPAGM